MQVASRGRLPCAPPACPAVGGLAAFEVAGRVPNEALVCPPFRQPEHRELGCSTTLAEPSCAATAPAAASRQPGQGATTQGGQPPPPNCGESSWLHRCGVAPRRRSCRAECAGTVVPPQQQRHGQRLQLVSSVTKTAKANARFARDHTCGSTRGCRRLCGKRQGKQYTWPAGGPLAACVDGLLVALRGCGPARTGRPQSGSTRRRHSVVPHWPGSAVDGDLIAHLHPPCRG